MIFTSDFQVTSKAELHIENQDRKHESIGWLEIIELKKTQIIVLVLNTINKSNIRKIAFHIKAKDRVENDIMNLVKNDSGCLAM